MTDHEQLYERALRAALDVLCDAAPRGYFRVYADSLPFGFGRVDNELITDIKLHLTASVVSVDYEARASLVDRVRCELSSLRQEFKVSDSDDRRVPRFDSAPQPHRTVTELTADQVKELTRTPGAITAAPSSPVEATLAERGARYGDFTDHARIAQSVQDAMRSTDGWGRLDPIHKQALTVIADKIARILSGDPDYADNWHDIQGYAKLVEDRLPTEK